MENHEILHVLLTGRDPNDIEKQYFKYPIPNLIFTRDIAAIIGKTILLTWGRRKVRNRENILAKYVFQYHEIFNNVKTYDFNEKHPNLTVEGGDILILNEKTICIGMSERTSHQTIDALLPLFFEEGFQNIYAIDLPKRRSTMHLDTIFNRINNSEAIVFPPLFLQNETNQDILTINYILPGQNLDSCKKTNQNFLQILKDCNIHLNPIKCGGDKKLNQEREQWTDGANYFTLSPGIILGYDCNFNTINELTNAGYECIEAKKFLNNNDPFNKHSKIMISIPSAELSRGRGGARCLTLPLSRGIINE
jgi:arginine deiminase